MKRKISSIFLCIGLMLGLVSGCGQSSGEDSQTVSEVSAPSAEQEATIVRWGIMEEEEKNGAPLHIMDSGRVEKINALLKEKGLDIQVEIEYILAGKEKNELESIDEQAESYDIVTFCTMGIGAKDMEKYLLPLEGYMAEGQPLNEVYQQLPEEMWQYDRIDGHNYNVGKLTGILYPLYTVNLKTEKQYDKELLLAEGDAAVPEIVQSIGREIKMTEPYVTRWGDELGVECYFHMIAPGVGINIENGTQFENVWESELMQQWMERELEWLENGISATYYESEIVSSLELFERGITSHSQIEEDQVQRKDGVVAYIDMIPCVPVGKLTPREENNYTSILKKSSQTEASLKLLCAMNTDAALYEAIHTPTIQEMGNQITEDFEELCCGTILTGEDSKDALSERIAELSEGQISPILGFAFDQKPVEEEMRALKEVIENEYAHPRIAEVVMEAEEEGKDVSQAVKEAWQREFEGFKNRLKEAGIERVIEEANRQLLAPAAQNSED